MNLRESLHTGWLEVLSHKMRSFLSFSAIAFGVAAILYTFAIVNQSLEKQRQAFELVGPGPIQITHFEWRDDKDKSLRLSRGLTTSDAEALRRALPWLHMISPTTQVHQPMHYKDSRGWVSIRGVTSDWRKRNWVYTLRGRFFSDYDFANGTRVCILREPGGWAKGKPPEERKWSYYTDDFDTLVKHRNLLHREIVIGKMVMTVIGIIKEPPKDLDPRWFKTGRSTDVIVPLKTAQRHFRNNWGGDGDVPDRVDEIDLDTGSLSTVPTATRRIQNLLKVLHRGEKDYAIVDLRQEIQRKANEMREHALTILTLGAIAILAGGVGIMNVTLATVFSRIREIGIRRAVGATRLDILSQFVTEAMVLGFLGGAAGILLGLTGLLFIAEEGIEKLESLVWWHILATMGISLGATFLFSLYPAYEASRMDPVESLRYE